MSEKPDTPKKEPKAVESLPEPIATPEQVSLDHFCSELSTTDRRVEMVNSFYRIEQRKGHLSDTVDGFQACFNQFITQPV